MRSTIWLVVSVVLAALSSTAALKDGKSNTDALYMGIAWFILVWCAYGFIELLKFIGRKVAR